MAACAYCDQRICTTHIDTCAICGKDYCPHHTFRCRLCERVYCQEAHHQEAECKTCHQAQIEPAIETVPALGLLQDRPLLWRWAENKQYIIYIGEHKGLLQAVRQRYLVVTDKAGAVIYQKVVGPWQWYFGERAGK